MYTPGKKRFLQAGERVDMFELLFSQLKIEKIILLICLMFNVSLAAAATTDEFMWTGGTCCGQNQPQYIHNPAALVSYFHSPGPNNSPGAYTTCTAPPTALGQSCYVYAWSTNLPYTSEDNCPIPKFPDINESDACTRSLETGAGKDVDKVCGDLDPEMVKQEACLANKIRRLGISYIEPSATIRTEAYQQHFVDLWEWHEVKIPKAQSKWTEAEKQACAPIVEKVDSEWNKHKLKGKPSNKGPEAPHVLRKAVDIDEAIAKSMMAEVSKPINIENPACLYCAPIPFNVGNVEDYVNSSIVNPLACKLRWGGLFMKNGKPDPDLVHFDLFLK